MAKETKDDEKESKIWLGKEGIVKVRIGKVVNKEVVNRVANDYKKITKNFSAKPKVSIDIRFSTPTPSSLFRKYIVEVLRELYKEPGFEKMALWGGKTILKVVAKFIISATGLKSIKYFGTEKEAIEWLKES